MDCTYLAGGAGEGVGFGLSGTTGAGRVADYDNTATIAIVLLWRGGQGTGKGVGIIEGYSTYLVGGAGEGEGFGLGGTTGAGRVAESDNTAAMAAFVAGSSSVPGGRGGGENGGSYKLIELENMTLHCTV